jgi:CRISPR-associated protein Cas2
VARVSEGVGRWLLVTLDLPVRSTAQRREATRFRNCLVDFGYEALHGNAYTRYLPPRAKVVTETNRLRKEVPEKGTVYIVELTGGSHRRALILGAGESVPPRSTPELMSVY